jgi:DnaJ-class molecular chaperone
MASSQDYQLLGVSKTATADELKKAYRKMAMQYHPDRNKTKEAEEKFKEVNKAYEVLSDPQKRQTYDQLGHQAYEQGGGGNPFGGAGGGPFSYTYTNGGGNGAQGFDFGGFSDPFDIFEQFFGGQSPFGRQARRPVYSITISFADAVHGAQKEVTIENKKTKLKIPAGVDRGSRIRFNEYDVVIDVVPDKKFHREGVDIVTDKEVSFAQAVIGMEAEIETIHGMVKIRIPAGTQPDTLIRLSGKGIPRLQGSGKGDHYVRVRISIPKTISKKQRELLEAFEKETSTKKSWF